MNYKNRELFTFVWKVENWRMKHFLSFKSPTFNIEKLLNTKWYLELFSVVHKDNFKIRCGLGRHESSEGPHEITIKFQLAVSDNPDEHADLENSQTEVFENGSIKNFHFTLDKHHSSTLLRVICFIFIDEEEIKKYISTVGEGSYLNLILTTAKYLKLELEPIEEYKYLQEIKKQFIRFSNTCLARTVVSMQKKTFTWSMEHILNSHNNRNVSSMTSYSDFPNFLINLHLSEENNIELRIQMVGTNETISFFFIYKACISDSEGNNFYMDEAWEIPDDFLESETIFETKNIFLEKPQEFFKTSHLSLEILITDGDTLNWIESTSPAIFLNSNVLEDQVSDNLRIKMKNIYMSKQFCDVSLMISGKKFEVHKAVLCANSPVFNAIFESGMQESITNFINIEDVDEDTMDRMLIFMYTETLEDMGFGATLKVYEAADKYDVLPLTKKCALYLRSNLSVENALNLFSISDAHEDKDLKSYALEFIVRHIKDVMLLPEWKVFSKASLVLANEILEKVCRNLVF